MSDAQESARLLRRFEELREERAFYEQTWRDITDWELGRNRNFQRERTPGIRKDRELYDTTAQTMISLLASGLHSLLTNPATEWFHLRTVDPDMMERQPVAQWLQTVEQIMYGAFQLPRARFNAQIHECYIDLVTFGTCSLFISDVAGEPRVLFSARPLDEIYIAEDASGFVDTVIRRFWYTNRQAVQRWGENAPPKAQSGAKGDRGEQRAKYIQVVEPSDDPTRKAPLTGERFAFASTTLSEDEGTIVDRGGFFEMPYAVARWEKDPIEIYGRSPGWNALADAKMASTMKKTTVQAGEMDARPPILMDDDGVVTQTAIAPGARISVRLSGGLNPPVQPLNMGSRAVIANALISDTRQQVQEAFLFELLQLIRDPRMTATQVLEISANIQRILAPILGRVQTELLEPTVDRAFALLLRKGAFPPAPPELQGQELKVEYMSPVARAQTASDTQAIVDTLTLGANWSQVDPSIIDIFDAEEAFRTVAAGRGVPAKILRSRADVSRIRRAQQQLAAEEQRKEDFAGLVDAAAKLQGGQQTAT